LEGPQAFLPERDRGYPNNTAGKGGLLARDASARAVCGTLFPSLHGMLHGRMELLAETGEGGAYQGVSEETSTAGMTDRPVTVVFVISVSTVGVEDAASESSASTCED